MKEMYDSLTGVYDTQGYYNKVENSHPGLVTLCVDISGMKNINMTYGYTTGDHVLKRTAHILTRVFDHAIIGRFNDDAFFIRTNEAGLLEKVEKSVRYSKYYKGDISVSLKIGIYLGEAGENAHLACDRARMALGTIKDDFSKCYQYYDEKMSENYENRRYIIEHFEDAIFNKYIKVYYQPIMYAMSNSVASLEALARWDDPIKGFLSPGDFINVLESVNLCYQLDLYILEQVCIDMKEYLKQGKEIVSTSINLSPNDFLNIDMVAAVKEVVDYHGIDHHHFIIEITESAFMKDPKTLKKAVDGFHKEGFQVWMDDFGSGYSSLNILKEYNFDLIKIDMGFLRHLEDYPKGKLIIKHMVELARDLHINTLVEGVEVPYHAMYLRGIGCDLLQGFYFSKPIPLGDQLHSLLAEHVDVNDAYYNDIDKAFYHLDTTAMPLALRKEIEQIAYSLIEYQPGMIHFIKGNNTYLDFLETHDLYNSQEYRLPTTKGFEEAIQTAIASKQWVFYEESSSHYEFSKGWIYPIRKKPHSNIWALMLIMNR